MAADQLERTRPTAAASATLARLNARHFAGAGMARSWMGVNAIHRASELLGKLARFEAETVTVDGLDYREGLNAVRVTGGVAGNVIPDRCDIEVNYRFAPTKDAAGTLSMDAVARTYRYLDSVELADVRKARDAESKTKAPRK